MEGGIDREQWLSGHGEWLDAMQRLFAAPATPRPKVTALMAGCALSLGVLGDVLFHGALPGVNVAAWWAALIVAYVIVGRAAGQRLQAHQLAFPLTSLVFATLVAWRAAPMLQAANLAAAGGLLLLGVAVEPGAGLRRLRLGELCAALLTGSLSLVAGAYRLLALAPWQRDLSAEDRSRAASVGRALLIATPTLLVFGGLFVAADAVFEARAQSILSVDVIDATSHMAWFAATAWLACGILWCGVAVETPAAPRLQVPDASRLKSLETAIILGSLAALFAAFVAVQARYLFGGEDVVQRSLHLTYAQYARRGFFELVAASALLLPVLLGLNWARSRTRASSLLFHALALVLVALLFAVMASALQRLRIYEEAFGLTQTRLYAAALLFWLGVVFGWFLWTLATRRQAFVIGAGAAAAVALIVLNVINPDALIARTNVDRISAAHRFDAQHASRLSADAVPTLVGRLDELHDADRCLIARGLLDDWLDAAPTLRDWNRGRWQAHRAVVGHQSELDTACSETRPG